MTQSGVAGDEAGKAVADRFIVDGRASRFTLRAFATGILAAMGHNPVISIREFSGELKFDPDQLKADAFRLVIKSKSLTADEDISDRDRREMERLMHQEVLESAKFPEIVYDASAIPVTKIGDTLFSAALDGNLALHGVTRIEPIVARVALMGSMLRASGEFSLSQAKYEIKPVSVAGGALKLKDELKLQFEIVARKQE
jgi:polyisoprenoid-binding protein YceI